MRKRTLLLLLLPIVLIIWTIGWAFLWVGNQQQTSKISRQKDNVHIIVQLSEQQEQEITE